MCRNECCDIPSSRCQPEPTSRSDHVRDAPRLAERIAERLGMQDEEMEFKSHYEQAPRDGRFMIIVSAPTEARKARATELLSAHGAHSVSFHGRFTIEELIPPREP